MNGVLVLQLFMLVAGSGGVINGLMFYGGFIAPRKVQREIPIGQDGKTQQVSMMLLGVFGSFLIGAMSGLLLYFIQTGNQPILQASASWPSGHQMTLMLLVGLGGTTFIDAAINAVQWKNLAALPGSNGATFAQQPSLPSKYLTRASVAFARLP